MGDGLRVNRKKIHPQITQITQTGKRRQEADGRPSAVSSFKFQVSTFELKAGGGRQKAGSRRQKAVGRKKIHPQITQEAHCSPKSA
jgi:hypothetical protein